MFFCPICNAKIEDNAKFCPKCGNKINKQIKKEAYEIVTIGLAVFALFLSIIPVAEVIIYISVALSIGAFGASVYSYLKNKKMLNWSSVIVASLALMVNCGWLYYYFTLK